jgi:FixJ family two-component response regulator
MEPPVFRVMEPPWAEGRVPGSAGRNEEGHFRGGAQALREGRLYRELTMIEVREVLRRFGAGQSKRRIGRETGASRSTVDRYVAAAEERALAPAAASRARSWWMR